MSCWTSLSTTASDNQYCSCLLKEKRVEGFTLGGGREDVMMVLCAVPRNLKPKHGVDAKP